jgi:hypothetical protein
MPLKLNEAFFDAINRADFNTKAAKCAAPVVNKIRLSISDNSILWANKSATVTSDTNGRDF